MAVMLALGPEKNEPWKLSAVEIVTFDDGGLTAAPQTGVSDRVKWNEAAPVRVPLNGEGVIVQFDSGETVTEGTDTTASDASPSPLSSQLTVPMAEVGTVTVVGVHSSLKFDELTPAYALTVVELWTVPLGSKSETVSVPVDPAGTPKVGPR
jgi:hypothetical protein